jgi:hypothetical protein
MTLPTAGASMGGENVLEKIAAFNAMLDRADTG